MNAAQLLLAFLAVATAVPMAVAPQHAKAIAPGHNTTELWWWSRSPPPPSPSPPIASPPPPSELITLMNALLDGMLPHVDKYVGDQIYQSIVKKTKFAGKLDVVAVGSGTLQSSDVIRTMTMDLLNLAMRPSGSADSFLPKGWDGKPFSQTTVGLNVNVDTKFFMSGASGNLPTIQFTLPGQGWSPSVSFSVKWVDAKIKMVTWLDLELMQIGIGFEEAPAMDWDVLISSSLTLGFNLPGWLTNDLTPTVANWFLSIFSMNRPIVIPFKKLMSTASPSQQALHEAKFAELHAALTKHRALQARA